MIIFTKVKGQLFGTMYIEVTMHEYSRNQDLNSSFSSKRQRQSFVIMMKLVSENSRLRRGKKVPATQCWFVSSPNYATYYSIIHMH